MHLRFIISSVIFSLAFCDDFIQFNHTDLPILEQQYLEQLDNGSEIKVQSKQNNQISFQDEDQQIYQIEQHDVKKKSALKLAKRRLVDIQNLQITFQEFNKTSNLVQNIISAQLYLDVKQRGWMFKINKGIDINKQAKNIMKSYIKKQIGDINIKSKLHEIRLFTPQNISSFETSQLVDKKWRVDIFPNEKNDKQKMTLKFQVQNDEANNLIRKYNYLLDTRKLGAINKE